MKKQHEMPENCNKARPTQDYTHLQEFIDNLPYIFMTVLGALVFILGLETRSAKWLFAGLYVFYGIELDTFTSSISTARMRSTCTEAR